MTDDDARIRRLLIESLDAELGSRLDLPNPARQQHTPLARRGQARWATPLAASAAVAVVAAALVAVGVRHHAPAPSGGGSRGVQITCASRGGEVGADRAAITARAQHITHRAVTVSVAGQLISVTMPGAKRSQVSRLCESRSVAFRPLVAPPVVDRSGTRSHPLTGLGFDVPLSDRTYERLTVTQRKTLTEALRTARCAPTYETVAAPTVACDSGELHGQPVAALLGRPIFTGSGINDARAQAPNADGAGSTQWTVAITLTKAASRQWASFTGQHNIGKAGPPTPNALTCSSTTTPCADFVAIVVDGQVASLPLTQSPINGDSTQVSGQLTKATATKLATALRTGELSTPLTTVTITATP